jgi:hypothetical protein
MRSCIISLMQRQSAPLAGIELRRGERMKTRLLLDYLESLEKCYGLDVADMEWKPEPGPADTVLLVLQTEKDKKDLLYITTSKPVDTRLFTLEDVKAIQAEVAALASAA